MSCSFPVPRSVQLIAFIDGLGLELGGFVALITEASCCRTLNLRVLSLLRLTTYDFYFDDAPLSALFE
jgi:hypothetical protein